MERIQLWKDTIPFDQSEYNTGENAGGPAILPYLIEDGLKHRAILVIAGGGYVERVGHEAKPVADYLNSLGFHAFVLEYRVLPYEPAIATVDGKRAIRYLRAHKEQFGLLDDTVGVIGFSAGGGIACRIAELYDKSDYEDTDEIDSYCARPSFCALCYAALSMQPEYMDPYDTEMIKQMVPQPFIDEYIRLNSCDLLVRDQMPPIFLWHAVDDHRVPVSGILSFVSELQKHNNEYELHIFPKGGHGKSVEAAKKIPGMCQWMPLFEDWLKRVIPCEKAVIFDMDGVIFDSETLCLSTWKQVAKEYGIENIETVFRKCIGTNANDTKAIMLSAYGESFEYDTFRKKASAIFHQTEEAGGLTVKPGVKELLTYLKENHYKIGLASSTREEVVRSQLTHAGFIDYFDLIVGGDAVVHSKPDPEIYLMACERLGVNPADTYVIEDSYNGIRSAYAAGMKPIMVPDLIAPDKEMRYKSICICAALVDLMGIL